MEKATAISVKKRLVQVGHWEGVSYLLLLGLAMPLKYFYQCTMAVTLFGSLHGFLFIWFCIILLWMEIKKEISLTQGGMAVLLALLPFGTFYLERYVFRQ